MSKKKKQSFRTQWRTLTEIGQEFGVSAIKLGKLLKEHGLREADGTPTSLAFEGAYVERIEPKDGKVYFLWHGRKVSEYLVAKGIPKTGISTAEASKLTAARKLARDYLEALRLDEEGSKLGYWIMCEMVNDIKKVGLDSFNQALKSLGYKGEPVTLEDW